MVSTIAINHNSSNRTLLYGFKYCTNFELQLFSVTVKAKTTIYIYISESVPIRISYIHASCRLRFLIMLSFWKFILSTLLELFRNLPGPRRLQCLLIILGNSILDVKGLLSRLIKGSLNALPALPLFTFVLIWVFLDWSLGASGFLKDMLFFCLSSFWVHKLEIYVILALSGNSYFCGEWFVFQW